MVTRRAFFAAVVGVGSLTYLPIPKQSDNFALLQEMFEGTGKQWHLNPECMSEQEWEQQYRNIRLTGRRHV